MANQKVYNIVINGIKESISEVDVLLNQLDNLEKRLKNLGKEGIKLNTKGLKDLEKIKIPEISIEGIDAKALKKEMQQLEKDIAKGAKTIDGEYTNTLNGLRAKLRDLKAELGTLDLDVDGEAFADLTDEIKELNDQVKQMEQDYGTFSRNVGNYTESMVDALNEFDGQMFETAGAIEESAEKIATKWDLIRKKVKEGGTLSVSDVIGKVSLNDLSNELNGVKKAIDNAVSEDDYNKLKIYYDQLNNVTEEFKKLRGEVEKTENKLKTEITRTINGQVYTWETLTSAVGELEDKLYQLAANGERNTDEFKSVAKAAAELKTQLRQVDYEIDSMVESSAGINKMMSMTQGFTALAQGAVGIGQLFGMDSENATKGIQTMVALQGIVSALQQVQEQIQKGTAFGKTMEKWIGYMKTFSTWTIYSSKEFKTFRENLTAGFSAIEGIDTATASWIDKSSKMISKSKKHFLEYIDIYKEIERLGGSVDKNLGGIAGLLKGLRDLEASGGSSPELNDLFNRVRSLQSEIIDLVSIFDGTNEKTKFLTSIEMFASNASLSFKKVGTSILNAVKPANLLNTAFKGLNLTLKGLTVALKGFAKATIVLAAFQVLVEIIGWITDIIGKTYQWAVGNDKLVNSLNKVETEIDLANKSIDRYIKNLEHLRDTNRLWVTDTEMATLKLEKLERELLKAAVALKDFSSIRGDGKSLLNNLTNGDTWFAESVESIEEFQARYNKLMKSVEAGTDETGKRGKGFFNLDIFNWFTISDAKADLGEMQIAVIKDLQYQINNLDLSKGTEEIRRFYEILQDPMYASSLENIENLFPEEEWAQVLKKRVEQIQSMYEQFDDAAKESVKIRLQEEERLTKELVEYQTNVAKQIRDNNTEAIEDEYKRELQALKNAKRDELDAAQGNLELIVSINKKYNRLEMDMLKKHQEDKLKEIEESEWDITNILRRIRDNRLSAEEESLDKHLQEIENERKDALEDAAKEAEEAAKEGHNLTELYNKLALSINIKYDALIKKEKEAYYQALLDMHRDYQRAMEEVNAQINADNLENKTTDIDINYNTKINSSESSYDFNGNYLQEEKKFNAERLKIELEYLEEKKKLDEEYANLDNDDALRNEKARYEDALRQLKDFKEQGRATEEEYNQLVEKENELHNQNLYQIEQKHQNDLTTINNQYLVDRKQQISQSLSENASLYQHYSNEVNDIMSRVGRDINIFGIIDYGKAKSEMDKAKQVVVEGIANIDAELKNLEKKRKSKQISFIDYKQAKEELEQTKKVLETQGEDISLMLKDLLSEVCSSWKGLVDGWVSQIGSLLTTMSDTQMQLIDNQMAEIEHQLELQEEAYDRAEEAAQIHKDKMEGIESELENARGERRLFLLEQLSAQQAAYEKDYAAQQKAAKQKEMLEKKQEALEKKRREEEKKRNVNQAIINTYTAVSNALAVQPWFVGLALSAVALALGLKNVAAIKSTPVFADGGVIQGASHANGGVKVLGGQAEVEGGEYITNKITTSKNVDVLSYINSKKKKLDLSDFIEFYTNGSNKNYSKPIKTVFADGGTLPSMNAPMIDTRAINSVRSEDNRPIYVSVTEIENVQNKVRNVRAIAGLDY